MLFTLKMQPSLFTQIIMDSHIHDKALRWRHNDHDGVSNHQPHGCLLNRLFRRRSKKTKLCVTGLCVGNSPGPVNSPHKGPVTRKMFPFHDVIIHDKPGNFNLDNYRQFLSVESGPHLTLSDVCCKLIWIWNAAPRKPSEHVWDDAMVGHKVTQSILWPITRADSRFAPSHWETSL